MSAAFTPTLNLLFALRCEAKPWIDHYSLQKDSAASLPLYRGAATHQRPFNVNLLISGIGCGNMASACGWLAAQQADDHSAWVNIGIAGHAELPVGEAALVVHSLDGVNNLNHYPPLINKWRGAKISLLTGNEVISDYPPNQAVDMEASAFFQAAKRFSTAELLQAIKIISDNQENSVDALNASRISELIAARVTEIDDYLSALVQLVPENRLTTPLYPEIEQLHCTMSQQQQFTDLSNKLANIGLSEQTIRNKLKDVESMKLVLQRLRDLQLSSAPALDNQQTGS